MYCAKAILPKHTDSNQLIIYMSAEHDINNNFNPFGNILYSHDLLSLIVKYGDKDFNRFIEYGFL